MHEEKASLMREVYHHVLPNLVYPAELQSFLEQFLGTGDIDSLIASLKEEISKTTDVTRKTDFQIFLNELQKRRKELDWENSETSVRQLL